MKRQLIISLCLTISFNVYAFDKNEFNRSIENIFKGSFNYAAKKAALALHQTSSNLEAHLLKKSSTSFSAGISSSYGTGDTVIYLGEGDVFSQLNQNGSTESSIFSSLMHSQVLLHLGGNYKKSEETKLKYDKKITTINHKIQQLKNSPWLINRIINYHSANEIIAKEYKTLKLLKKHKEEIKQRIALKISSIKDEAVIDRFITSVQYNISELKINRVSLIKELSKYAPLKSFDYYKKYITPSFTKQIIKPTLKKCNKIFGQSKIYEINKIQSAKKSKLISLSGTVATNLKFTTSSNLNDSTTNYGVGGKLSFTLPLLNNYEKTSIKALSYYETLITKYKFKEIERNQRNISETEVASYNQILESYKKFSYLFKSRKKDLVKFSKLEDAAFITPYKWGTLYGDAMSHFRHLSNMKASLIILQLSSIYACYLESLNN